MEEVILTVLDKVAGGKEIEPLNKHKVRIEGNVIHYRYKSSPKKNPNNFLFNINPNSINADFGLFICGDQDNFYLIPVWELSEMYNHPEAYPDRSYPGGRVITIETEKGSILFAKPSIRLYDIELYRNVSLPHYLELFKPVAESETKISEKAITVKKYGIGGEAQHKSLKNLIAENPSLINIENVIRTENDSYIFLSSDRPDILFSCSGNIYSVIEIEIENCWPGAYQAIKYRSLLCAELGISLDSTNVKTVLVARKIQTDVKKFCEKYHVLYYEIPFESLHGNA